MDENNIGKLVKKAKGDDRSLREYARDSGVDAAVISKIINGTYVPKKTDVYKSLTSQEASPRGGVTYKQLVEAADSSKSYQAGIVAGMAATEAALKAIGGLPIATIGLGAAVAATASSLSSAKRKGGTDKADEVINEIQQFVAISNGLIFSALGAKGISFQIKKDRNDELKNQFDTYLKIDGHEVKEYIFRYVYLSKEHQKIQYIVENTPRRMIEELVFLKPSKERKVTIVTNYPAAFDYMLSYKNKISYNGDLSIMLVDVKRAELHREEYILHFAGEGAARELYIS